MDISVRDFKDHLSEYLRRVQAGESIVVTSHGRAVARLVPPLGNGVSGDDALEVLRSMPWVRAGNGKRPKLPSVTIKWPARAKPLSELVAEDRE